MLVKPILLIILLQCTLYFGHSQERYVDSLFGKINVETFTYSDTLTLDFYSAQKDKEILKPLIIVVHGGGFASGKQNNPLERKFSMEMAKKGYAVASIGYRLLRKGKGFGCDVPAMEKMETFIAISEDILKASNYMVAKSTDFRIDPDKIVLVGSSAGAEGVLNTVFMRNHYLFKKLPYNNINFAGVVSLSGALINASYITKDTAIPSLFIHGKKDNLVPYATASHHYCNPEKPGYILLDGAQSMVKKLDDLGVSYFLGTDQKGNHDWANLGYGYTDMISGFLKKTIIEGQYLQAKTSLKRKQ